MVHLPSILIKLCFQISIDLAIMQITGLYLNVIKSILVECLFSMITDQQQTVKPRESFKSVDTNATEYLTGGGKEKQDD